MTWLQHVQHPVPFRWSGVPLRTYKDEDGARFRGVTRQVLFDGGEALGAELRYFEIEPGGHSTLERHQHEHLVMVLRGEGRCLVGDRVLALAPNDVIHVPPWAWHQFRAPEGAPLGFLCLVRRDRDRPQLPTAEELRELSADPEVASFVRG
jgi:quercetin dioxygenase-like cupin family protein